MRRYSLDDIVRGLTNPSLFAQELNRLYHRRLYTREYNTDGVDIFREDWDNLIILDACRYDIFEDQNPLDGTLSKRTSRGSMTVEFLHGNFRNRDLRDTVYMTANPMLYRRWDDIQPKLHDVQNIWLEEGWDETLGTVLPETTTDYALEASEDYGHKRLIVHFVQPHYPFINQDTDFDKGHLDDPNPGRNFWGKLMDGRLNVPRDFLWEAYTENLDTVWDPLRRLTDRLTGKTVITSDHGNIVEEPESPIPVNGWGHPRGIYTDKLVTVPWFEMEYDSRREITTGERVADRARVTSDEVVSDRLEQLGYLE